MALAAKTGIDVTLVRLAFLLLSLAWGAGAALYLGLWVAMPNPGYGEARLGEVVRRNIASLGQELGASSRRARAGWRDATEGARSRGRVAVGVLIGGLLLLLISLGAFEWVTPVRFIGLLIIAAGAFALLSLKSSRF